MKAHCDLRVKLVINVIYLQFIVLESDFDINMRESVRGGKKGNILNFP